MKKIFVIAFLFISSFGHSQNFELKTNPLFLLFGVVNIDGEYIINDHAGVELGLSYIGIEDANGFAANFLYKYYFTKEGRADRFNIFPYLQVIGAEGESAVGFGFGLGYKWVSRGNVIFEIGGGLGRSSGFGVSGYGKLAVGYRFRGK